MMKSLLKYFYLFAYLLISGFCLSATPSVSYDNFEFSNRAINTLVPNNPINVCRLIADLRSLETSDIAKYNNFREALSKREGINAWRMLDEANRTTLKINPNVITQISNVLENQNLKKFLPITTSSRNIVTKEDFVKELIRLQEAGGNLSFGRMSSMESLMENLNYFLTKYADSPDKAGALKLIRELTESDKKIVGGSFVLDVIKNYSDDLGELTGFEVRLSNEADEIGDIVVDLKSRKADGTEFLNEFKNWESIPTIRYAGFAKQFTGYLSAGDNIIYRFKKGVNGLGILDNAALKTGVMDALSSVAGRAELAKIPEIHIIRITGDNQLKTVDDLLMYLENQNNFNKIFKLID